jgi:hypothetical protein
MIRRKKTWSFWKLKKRSELSNGNPNQTKIVLRSVKQSIRNGSSKWSGRVKGPHETVKKAKWQQNWAHPTAIPHRTSHPKMAAPEKALQTSDGRPTIKRVSKPNPKQ